MNLIKSWGLSNKVRAIMLAAILKDKSIQEQFLRVERASTRTDDKNKVDAAHISNYAKSEDYAVFSREVWETVINNISDLCKDDLTECQVHFLRGSLASNLDVLRISYKAHEYLQSRQEVGSSYHSGKGAQAPIVQQGR